MDEELNAERLSGLYKVTHALVTGAGRGPSAGHMHRDLGWNRDSILQSFGALRMFLKFSTPQMSEMRVSTPRAVGTKENGLWTSRSDLLEAGFSLFPA